MRYYGAQSDTSTTQFLPEGSGIVAKEGGNKNEGNKEFVVRMCLLKMTEGL